MAVPLSHEDVEQNDDFANLSLAQSYFTMSETAAWRDLIERIGELVDKAQQEHFSDMETDPAKIIAGKLRWQQRLLLRQAILQIVQKQLELRETIIEEMKGTNEHPDYNAE